MYLGTATTSLGGVVFSARGGEMDVEALKSHAATVAQELERLEKALTPEGRFREGDSPMADFTAYSVLALYRRMRPRLDGALGPAEPYGPGTEALMARVEALPFFDTTYPPHWRE